MNPYLVTLWTVACILVAGGGLLVVSNLGLTGDPVYAAAGGFLFTAGLVTILAALVAGAVTWRRPEMLAEPIVQTED